MMTLPQTLSRALVPAIAAGSLLLSSGAFAADNPKVAAEVIALAKAQWASGIAEQSTAHQMSTVADDYTEFNPQFPTLIVGKSMNSRMTDIKPATKTVFADMQNPHVQVYGDTAILTYNYAGIVRASDGKTESSTAKSTRVYSRMGGRWMLVHANFAPVEAAD
jgi:ketosteroid isomerase-like protein